jgi:xanthine dehydrogenase accessory factor
LHEAHGTGVWLSGDGKQALLLEDGTFTGDESDWDESTLQMAREVMIKEGHTHEIGEGDSKILLRLIAQPYRLFIIGAGHISLSLVHFAKALNYQTIVIDPRESFAQEERFETKPDHLIQKWPEVALKEIRFTPCDSMVMLTHDPKIDDQALEIVLKSDCSYVGALGSRKSHGARLKRLAAKGFDADELERIHGPVGLDIGSTTPAEIAVSIVAEMVQLKNKQSFKNQVEDTAIG